MARKKNGETKLIMPKHLAEVPYFRLALKVYAAHPHGVGFDVFKDELYTELHSEGVESAKSSDGSHYTKCAQLPRYFGMVRYVSSSEAKGDAALTLRGQRMYAAMTATPVDSSTIHELIFEAIRFNQFGRRNEGVGSESYCEPLAIFFKAARDLDGVTNKEFGYILQELDQGLKGYRTVIAEILQQRAAGGTIPVVAGTQADNLSDWKAILFLKNVGFLEKDVSGKVKLTGALVEKYGMELSSLPLYSNGFKRQIFSNWLRSKGKDEQTVDNYRRSLEGMSQRIGSKTSGTFEGFYEALVGREPIKMVFDVTSLADYDRVFAALNWYCRKVGDGIADGVRLEPLVSLY